MAAQLQKEVDYMFLASSSCRVVNLHAAIEEAGYIFMLLELCEQGSLEDELAASKCLSEALAARYARQLFEGLMDLHSLGIIHRDVKLGNLLVTSSASGPSVKITDFGWAASSEDKVADVAGTFEMMAPEILRGEVQTTAVDMWSAGAVIFQLLTGQPLLPHFSTGVSTTSPHEALHIRRQRLLQEMMAFCPLSESARPAHVSKSCWNFLSLLLTTDVDARATAQGALQHEWLKPTLQMTPDVDACIMAKDTSQHEWPKQATPSPTLQTPATSTPSTPDVLSARSNFSSNSTSLSL